MHRSPPSNPSKSQCGFADDGVGLRFVLTSKRFGGFISQVSQSQGGVFGCWCDYPPIFPFLTYYIAFWDHDLS